MALKRKILAVSEAKMQNNRSQSIAERGLVDRRSFIKSGLGLLAASLSSVSSTLASSGSERFGAHFPSWMKTPGNQDTEYGLPSSHEKAIKRQIHHPYPGSQIFSVAHTPIHNQKGIITPNGLHFGVHHNGIPKIEPAKHKLIIHGLVERPLTFDIETLLRYPMVSRIHFLECSGNTALNALHPEPPQATCQDLYGQISGAEWTGIPVSWLLKEAGLKPKAKWVITEGADAGSHARSIPLEKILDDAIIALYQNGERLRPQQGYPFRLFLPGWEGNTSVKWLHRLEIADQPAFTKDESALYAEVLSNGKIRYFSFHMNVKSVILHPSAGHVLPDTGFYEISGLAWSGHGKIRKVEVSVDGGHSWVEAQLHPPILRKALTRFSLPWNWTSQPTVLMSRATDEIGQTQLTRSEWKRRYADYSFNHYNAVQAWQVNRSGEVNNVYA